MNLMPPLRLSVLLIAAALCHAVPLPVPAAERPDPAKEDFSPVAAAVVKLLESGDAAAFAKGLAPSIEDWRLVASTNRNAAGEDPLGPSWQKSLDRQRQQLEAGAKQILAKAAELKVDFTGLKLSCQAIPPKALGSTRYSSLQAEGESLPLAPKVDLILTATPLSDSKEAGRLRGEYKLSLVNLHKFPSGWRASEPMRWVSFPSTVADEKTQREMNILTKVASHATISAEDDSALKALGEAMTHFVRARDAKIFEAEAMLNVEAVWSMIQKLSDTGRQGPSRAELDEHWHAQRDTLLEPAQAMAASLENQGINLKDAEIQVAKVELRRLTPRGGSGTLEGLAANEVQVTLAVKSNNESNSGKNLSGDYVIAAGEALRIGDRWYISAPVRWDKFPDGVVDKKTMADLKFESYVAEHGSLPPGTVAPDFEFVTVSDEQKGALKDLRGKVVILDFWATWCGPCQEPMAKMQLYRAENPEWKDRVAVVSLSIDDTLKVVRSHLDKRGWTNSFNLWAGEGGWQSAPAKAYHVRGVPTCYVIDAEGKVVKAGHPVSLHAPEVVNRLLK